MRWWQSESASRAVGYMVDEGVGEGQTAGQEGTWWTRGWVRARPQGRI